MRQGPEEWQSQAACPSETLAERAAWLPAPGWLFPRRLWRLGSVAGYCEPAALHKHST